MICVSIGRGRHRHMLAEHKHLVEIGAQLVELRLDFIQSSLNLKRLVDNRPGPVIITCRREQDGGKWTGTEEARQMILRSAIASGVDYVDLEDDIASKVPRFGKTKRIVSHHDFRKTPDNLEDLHARLSGMDPDIVKIATLANHPQDNLRMLRLIKNSKVPTIGICMGDIGTPTRILAGKFGAPITFATFSKERAMAPGQISYQEMIQTYRYDRITDATAIYGVVADPVGHSLSPQVHNAAFAKLDLDAVYIPFRVPAGDIGRFVDDCQELGIRGLSVTIPHKENIASKLNAVDAAVKGIGAVNTVLFEDGKVKGFNTDYKAAIDSLEHAMGGVVNETSPIEGKTVMVLGAGGAARSIVYGLNKRGAHCVIANRTHDRAKQLATDFGCRCVEWAARHGVGCDVLVNCTPVGMHPDVDESPYDKNRLRTSMVIFDTVYNPESTLLIKDARDQGCAVVTGVEMFVRQAAWQFYLFTGKPAPADVMRETMKRCIGAVRYGS